MDLIHSRRRVPEWKQGWSNQTLGSMSAPPLPLMAIFAIVIFLLSISQYSAYKEQMQSTMVGLKLVLLLVPVILIFVLSSSLVAGGGLNFWSPRRDGRRERWDLGRGLSGFPWGVAVLVLVLLVLVSYQSSFHSKWFPFGSSD